jgi:transcriptional regulator with XRE-family HTH domain
MVPQAPDPAMLRKEKMSYFFGNLSRLMTEARITPRQLSSEIGRDPDYVSAMLQRRAPPDLEAVYGIAEALRVDVADLLRPGPSFGFTARQPGKYWAEQLAEKVLAGALEESRQATDFEAPTFDAVLNWWHANGGLLTGMEKLEQYIEIFSPPDADVMRPVPRKIGRQSLAARELNITTVEQLNGIFENSEPAVARTVALAHASVIEGQPRLSFHTITADMSTGHFVKMSYIRLLLPVRDGDGQRYVMNYSKPVRRNEIGREDVGEFETIHRGQPMFASLD